MVLVEQREIKAVVPIGDMERLSRRNGTVSKDEVEKWLDQLDWKEEDGGTPLFGVLNLYMCRGVKPSP